MTIVQINATCGSGSTGKICVSVSQLLNDQGVKNYILYSSRKSNYQQGIKYTSNIDINLAALASRILGNYGFEGKLLTKRLIKELDRIKPDIVHIHNVHSHNCNLEMLFNYIRENHIKTYWTFHDCWAFTAYCPNFDMIGCDRWKTECHECTLRKSFSWFFDKSSLVFSKKKSVIQDIDLTIITPSLWLSQLVKESFLKSFPVKVINNGIDLDIFKPSRNNFREKYKCEDKFIILGVAFGWGRRKGLDVFIELAKRLDKENQIVLVGTDDKTDVQLPGNIISIHCTQNQQELAEIYSAADLFVNPTREENFPTVNIEAIACGTPVLTFRTGGSPEIIDDTCGSVVDCDDIDAMEREIRRICTEHPYSEDACLRRAQRYDKDKKFPEYIDLYKDVIQKGDRNEIHT